MREQLRSLWSEVLDQPEIPDDADFFQLGGTSVTAVTLAAKVQEHLSVPFDAVEVIITPTFGELCEVLEARAA